MQRGFCDDAPASRSPLSTLHDCLGMRLISERICALKASYQADHGTRVSSGRSPPQKEVWRQSPEDFMGCTLRSVHGAERAAPGHRSWTLAEQLYDSRSRIHRVAGRFIDRTPYKTTFELLFASYGVHEPPDFCGIANALTFAYRTSEIEHETHASTRNCLAFRAREDQGSQAPADRDGRCSLCFRSHRNNIRSYALTIATFGRIHSLGLRRQQTGFSCLRYASLSSRVRPRWYVAVFAHRRQRHCRLADKTRGFG